VKFDTIQIRLLQKKKSGEFSLSIIMER